MKQQPWWPYASAAAWGVGVLVLVLVNSGNVLLAVGLAVVVALISWRIDGGRRRTDDAPGQAGGSASS